MRVIRDFIKWYVYITTGILFVVAGNFALYRAETLPGNTLWQILLSGFLTTLVTVVLFSIIDTVSMKEWKGISLHYLGLCIVMILNGYWFGWIGLHFSGILLMMLSVALVYLIVCGTHYLLDVKQADEVNRRLQDKYPPDPADKQ